MKTYLYNLDPLKPHFYIVKLGFTVYIIFLIFAQNKDCGYTLELPRRGGSNEYPQSVFWAEIWKNILFFIWKFSVFGDEIFYIYLNRRVFVMRRRSKKIAKLSLFLFDLVSGLTLSDSNYPYFEQISMVQKMFELLHFDYSG